MASQHHHQQQPTTLSTSSTVVDTSSSSSSHAKLAPGSNVLPLPRQVDGLPHSANTAAKTFHHHRHPQQQQQLQLQTPPPPLGEEEEEEEDDEELVPTVIPPTHAHRTLVVCFDGTGDQFDNDNSNVVQLVALLKKDDMSKQLVYYQTGIGTYNSGHVAHPLASGFKKALDLMFAMSLNAHVMGGYEFLMQNYMAGDRICLFGFSRGAYTARSLAGMLHKVGLLPTGNFQQVPFAYKMYQRADDVGWEQSNEFKKAFSVDVNIDFIGVWDTVDSVGIIPKRLPFTTSNTLVRVFRHALALDERRAKFKANLWNRPNEHEATLGLLRQEKKGCHPQLDSRCQLHRLAREPSCDDDEKEEEGEGEEDHGVGVGGGGVGGVGGAGNRARSKTIGDFFLKRRAKSAEDRRDQELNELEMIYSNTSDTMTDIEEVWFAGCHGDVGGGSVSNKTRHSLARIPLRWMIRECFKANTGIMFHSDKLREIGLDPSTLYPHVRARPPPPPPSPPPRSQQHRIQTPPLNPIPIRTQSHLVKKKKKHDYDDVARMMREKVPFLGTEEEEEVRDAVSPKYDQLRIAKLWWLLEVLPLRLRYQTKNNEWVTMWWPNLGKPRYIPQQRISLKVHRSVKMRMEAEYEDEVRRQKGKQYVPKPTFRVAPTWID